MARSIAEIQQSIVDAIDADSNLSGLTSTSLTADWLLWTWVCATAMWVTENLFDSHKAEVAGIIGSQKPHTLKWYATKAKAFQYGASLPADSDVYSPVAADGDASLIISYAAAVEDISFPGMLRIKVATLSGSVLAKITSGQLTAFTAYMNRIKDAGVRLNCTSNDPDNFQTAINIYYDPLILDDSGARLDGSAATSVQDGINAFLDTLPFNGVFSLDAFIAALNAINGVVIAEVLVAQANHASLGYVDIIAATPNVYTPDAGYMTLDSVYFLANVSYVAYV